MSTSKIVAFRTAFASALATQLASDGTTGVTIHKYPQTDPDREDQIILGHADANQEHHTFGGSRIERFTLTGDVWCWKDGGTDTEAAAAETRALLIYASVENLLRTNPSISSTVFDTEAATYTSELQVEQGAFIGHVEFTVEVEAHL